MTTLTDLEAKREGLYPTNREVIRYFKTHPKIPRNSVTIGRVRDRLRASKLAKAPGKQVSFTQSAAEWQIIYGTAVVGGALTFIGRSGSQNQRLNYMITIAGHEIDEIEKMYLDGEEVVLGESPDPRWSTGIIRHDGTTAPAAHKIFLDIQYGEVGQTASASLIASAPGKWTSAHKQAGCAGAQVTLTWDAALFPDGPPEITFKVRGKPVKLPDNSTAFTSNAAAIIRDYLTDTRYGMGIPESKIDADQYLDAYTICSADINLGFAGTEKRYTINGVFSVAESPREILETMCAAMGGTVTYVNGKWKIFPAAYRVPVYTLTESDILGNIRIQTKLSRSDSFNGVRGTFISPTKDYEETDFPSVKNDYYLTLDNDERVWEDIQLPLTTSAATAQRLAKIELERNRQAITVQAKFSLAAYQLEPMDTVYLTIDRYGWSGKIFEIQEATLVSDGGSGTSAIAVDLLLRETASAIYDWSSGEETAFDVSPNTDLPAPLTVPVITGLALSSGTTELYIRNDGVVFTRMKVSWTQADDFFVTSGGAIQIQYKKSADSDWMSISDLPGDISNTFILDVHDSVLYDVRVRAKNALGVTSDWTTIEDYTVIGKTAAPSDVPDFSATVQSFGVNLVWTEIPDLDKFLYEIRQGSTGSTWESASFIARVAGDNYASDIQVVDNYKFFIKAIDTSGNYSTNARTVESVVTAPEAPTVTATVNKANFRLTWDRPVSQFAIDYYEVAYALPGDDYEDRTYITTTKATNYEVPASWVGVRVFFITAVDVGDNFGSPGQTTLEIQTPTAVQNLTNQVMGQNVELKWEEPATHTLPIDYYAVYKGATFATATLIGTVDATVFLLVEPLGGSFTYFVVPVDTATNEGPENGASLTVQNPADFILIETGDPENLTALIAPTTFSGANISTNASIILMPVNVTETWDEHFITNGWTNTADAVTAGYAYLIQPVPTIAYAQRVLNYGTVIPAALITLDYTKTEYDGSATVRIFIGYSLDNISYTTVEATQAYGTNFQYVKIRFHIGTYIAGGTATGIVGLTYP